MDGESARPWWRTLVRLAVLLTLGLLGWELVLLWFLSGDFGMPVSVLGPRLARDAASLFLVAVVALSLAGPRPRSGGLARTTVQKAAAVSSSFLLMLLPVTFGRNVPRQPTGAQARGAVSVAGPDGERADRFLCAAIAQEVPTASVVRENDSRVAVAQAGVRDALLLQVPVFPLMLLLLRRRSRPAASRSRAVGSLLPLLLCLGLFWVWKTDGERPLPGEPSPREEESGCLPGAPVRSYFVAAISVDLPLNAWGDHVPRSFMYVLEEELPAVREKERNAGPLQPLVLRANLGECLVLHFTNRLADGPAALRIEGLRATVRGSAGGFVPGTSVDPGQRLTYVLSLSEPVAEEGIYLLHDSEDGGEREARGLFGALVLEPAGAVYRDSSTGEPLRRGSGWEAIIDVPSGEAFREMVLLYHAMGPPEVADVRSARGALLPVLDEMAGPFRPGAFAVNYRSEPHFEREALLSEDGEPRRATTRGLATPLLRSYLGEPVKLRVAHAGSAEFHVHHLHGWDERRGRGARPSSGSSLELPHLLSPGRGLTLATAGTEGFPRMAGDFVVHCHMPNHSTGGERLSWRVFSERQPQLAPLPGRAP
ncbi:cupredoxin [Vitiosangium sp. GDMCC 1.1324]|uniref:cupredoxin n=1 Tax=Vitiosangium sp. (strain GDMCC 1.1324) TaxID=2138576 RepID=UPI000D34C306|nr:cupredoxin [Vitiosangium sp. GDMCC 1.1324]PTL80420.1 cupredoxin [Vitiosangium sp. GDMCC 1.1324]